MENLDMHEVADDIVFREEGKMVAVKLRQGLP